MRVIRTIILFSVCLGLPAAGLTKPSSEVKSTLSKYFKAAGGLKQINKIKSLSFKSSIEASGEEYNVTFLDDGRFRIEGSDRVTVFDGKDYWLVYHDLVGRVPEERLPEYKDHTIRGTFFHGLIGKDGKPVSLSYAGSEEKRGQTYTVLESEKENGKKKKFYFNTSTGMVDKLVELIEDPEYRELVNVYRFSGHQQVGDIKLLTKSAGQCITNNDMIQPPMTLTDIKVNGPIDEKLFTKPASKVPAATFKDGTITGKAIAFSPRGSVITNITEDDLAKLDVADGGMLKVRIKDKTYEHKFIGDIRTAEGIGFGDYIALFNQTPALWIVKAYVGMTSEIAVSEGDKIEVSPAK